MSTEQKPAHYKLLDVIEVGLEAAGYNGLVYPGACMCKLENLSPNGCLEFGCTPGYLHAHSIQSDYWIISVSNDPLSDDDILYRVDEGIYT